MGDRLSTFQTNPSYTQSSQPATMSSEEPSQAPQLDQAEKESSESETLETKSSTQVSDPSMEEPKILEDQRTVNNEEEDTEEEGECGFCLFMKGGGCRETFIAWENCIEEAEKSKEDIVEKCFEVTGALKKCMEVHSDYYAPILQAEKAAEEEAVRELEKEKEREKEKEKEKERAEESEQPNVQVSEQDDSKVLQENEGS